MKVFLLLIILIITGCSINFYPKNYKGEKRGYIYYEVKTDSSISRIYKMRKTFFSKKDKLIKIIEIDNEKGYIYIYPKGLSRVIIYDKQGNKSKGAYYKDGHIVLMFPAF